jgi:hypothetical protein
MLQQGLVVFAKTKKRVSAFYQVESSSSISRQHFCIAGAASSLKLTRYGRRCTPGLRQSYDRRSPGLQHRPSRAA